MLSEHELVLICTKLHSVGPEWFGLGLTLGIRCSVLETIRSQNRGSCKVCLREMLSLCLRSECTLTWRDLCICLRTSTVGHSDVAEEIEEWIKGLYLHEYGV